jgi:hypothetical protein
MPRYFFHIEDGKTAQDEDGVELESLARAKCEAVRLAGQSICDCAPTFWNTDGWKLTASDEDGLILFSLYFAGTDAPAADVDPSGVITAYPTAS